MPYTSLWMASRPTALLVAPEIPYPTTGGGALRTASVLEYLSRRYDTDALVFRQPGEPDPALMFPEGLTRKVFVVDLPLHARNGAARAWRNLSRLARRVPPLVDRFSGFAGPMRELLEGRRYSLAVVEHFWCAPYADVLRERAERVVLNLHNLESELHARCAASEPWPVSYAHARFAQASLGLERELLAQFSLVLAPSAEGAARVGEIAPAARVAVYPNALPEIPAPDVVEEDAIIFTGNLEYHPNIAAVRYFRRDVWPRLRELWTGLEWRIAGRNPHAIRRWTRGDPRIVVTGPVDDAVKYIARAKVAIVPLLAGSGTRLKILEGWAAARPVVSTTIGAEGLPARDSEHLLLADGPGPFADAVSRLLADPALRAQLGAAGRALYEKGFTWGRAWKSLEKLGV